MLESHDKVLSSGEPWVLLGLLSKFDFRIPESMGIGMTNSLNEAKRHAYEELGVSDDLLKKAGAAYYSSLTSGILREKNKTVFVDKTPRYYMIVEDIINNFPDATIVIIQRNRLEVFDSIYRTWLRQNPFLLGYFKRDLLSGPEEIETAIRRFSGRENVLVVRYDDLVKSPEVIQREIFSRLGLSYFSEVLTVARPGPRAFGDPIRAMDNDVRKIHYKFKRNSLHGVLRSAYIDRTMLKRDKSFAIVRWTRRLVFNALLNCPRFLIRVSKFALQ